MINRETIFISPGLKNKRYMKKRRKEEDKGKKKQTKKDKSK